MISADLVIAGNVNVRTIGTLDFYLGLLSSLHGIQLPAGGQRGPIPKLVGIAHPAEDGSGRYPIDIDALKSDADYRDYPFVDLVVRLADRNWLELRGHLEEAPGGVFQLDPDDSPSWLS